MVKITSAKRYARAVFELALEKNELEGLKNGLQMALEVSKDTDLITFLENPRIPFDAKKTILERRLGGINPLALNLTLLAVSRGLFKIFPKIYQEFISILDKHYGIERAKVITAIQLDEKEKETISHQLGSLVNRKVLIENVVDPNIIAGFIARIKDKLIDASIRQRLDTLKKNLVEAR